MPDVIQIIIEVVSAVLCFVLVSVMSKPFWLTRESRYLGLPLGFAFLAASEVLLAVGLLQPFEALRTISLVLRTFAFIFLAFTYLFSKKQTRYSRIIWNVTFSLIAVISATMVLILFRNSIMGLVLPASLSVFLRVIALVCIGYVCLHTLASHMSSPTKESLLMPLGFILLGISQYSLLIWAVEENYLYGVAFAGGWITRITAYCVFIAVWYLSLCRKESKAELK